MAADKTNNLTAFLTDIATTIRTAEGTIADINPQDFSDRIEALPATVRPNVGRAETTLTVTADDTNDKLTIAAANNQGTGYVTGANKTASTTISLTASGKTVTATATDGTKISKNVSTASRASTTIATTANDTADTLTVTASNNQGTGYVTGSNKTASKIVTLSVAQPTIDASGNVTAVATAADNSSTPVSISKTSETLALGAKTSDDLSVSGAKVSVPAGYYPSNAEKSVATATRANTSISVTADDTADTLKIDASNNQSTGYVTGANKTATTTVTLTASGATVTATETGGKKVSKSVATASRAGTTLTSTKNTTNNTLDFTAANNQSTGYVTGSNSTATKSVSLSASGATVTASDGTNSISKSVSTVGRANTTLTSSKNTTNNTLDFTASNNQGTGYVTGANKTATKTVSLSTSGATVTATDGTNSISASVTTASRANTTISATADDTANTITVTGANNQSTGYVTGANKTASDTITLSQGAPTVNSTTGVVTATSTMSESVSKVSVSASNTLSLSTQGAKTVTPSTSSQTAVAAGKYTTGAVTVAAVPTQTKSATPTTSAQTVSPDSGKFLSAVTVNAIPSNYVIPSGSIDITKSGETSVSGYATAKVAAASFEVSGASVKTKSTGGGYVAASTTVGTIPSGSVSLSNVSITNSFSGPTYNSSTGKYDITASGSSTISPSVTAGYVSSVSSKTASASGTKSLDKATFSTSGRTVSVSKSGYIEAGTTAGSISTGSCSVSGGGLTSGSGAVTATGTNVTLTELSAAPSSGAYITVTGSGSVSRAAITKTQSAGYISSGTSTSSSATSKSSNTATKYYAITGNDEVYLYGVYQFISTPTGSGLSYNWSQIVSEPITFGWTGTTSGSPGTVYENICNTMKVQYGSYGLAIWYGSDVAYTNTTYGGISSYTGWQAIDGVGSTTTRTIIIATPYRISSSSAFYQWFSNNTERVGDWDGGGSSGGSGSAIETGTLRLNAIPGESQIWVPRLNNDSITYGHYTSGMQSITNVILNAPFFIYMGLDSAPYIYKDTSGITDIGSDLNDAGYYTGVLTSTSGSVRFWYDCCFDGQSKVLMADSTEKALVDIAIGDIVMTYDEITGASATNEVTALGTVKLTNITELTLEDGTVIRMNVYHPMWTEKGWKSIVGYKGMPRLTAEDKLLNNNGEYVAIKSIEEVEIDTTTYYTLKVANNNNFYVNGYLAQGKDKD